MLRLLLKWAGMPYESQRHHRAHHRREFSKNAETEDLTINENNTELSDFESNRRQHRTSHSHKSGRKRSQSSVIKRKYKKIKSYFAAKLAGISKNTWLSGFKKRLGIKPKRPNLPETLFYKAASDGSYKVIKARPITSTGMNEDTLPDPTPVEKHSQKHHHRGKKPGPAPWTRRFLKFFGVNKQITAANRHKKLRSNSNGENLQNIIQEQLSTLPQKAHEGISFRQIYQSWIKPGFILKLLGSIGLFMLAYVTVWLIYSLAVIFTASFYDIYAVLYYYEVMWPAGNAMPPWTDAIAIAVTVSGPLVSITLAILSYYLLNKKMKAGSNMRTFLFWIFLLSLAHFFGAFAAGAVTWEGFGYVIDWLHMRIFFILLFSTLSLAVLVFLGWKYARFVLEIRPVRKNDTNHSLILINRMILPMLIGSALLILIKIPVNLPQHPFVYDYDSYILASGLFFAIPPLFNRHLRPVQHSYKHTTAKAQRIKTITIIAISFGLVAIYRLGLSGGLYLYMKFAFSVTPY